MMAHRSMESARAAKCDKVQEPQYANSCKEITSIGKAILHSALHGWWLVQQSYQPLEYYMLYLCRTFAWGASSMTHWHLKRLTNLEFSGKSKRKGVGIGASLPSPVFAFIVRIRHNGTSRNFEQDPFAKLADLLMAKDLTEGDVERQTCNPKIRMPSRNRNSFSLTIVDTIVLVGTMNANTSKRLKASAAAAAPRSIVTAGQGNGLISTSKRAGKPSLPSTALPRIALHNHSLYSWSSWDINIWYYVGVLLFYMTEGLGPSRRALGTIFTCQDGAANLQTSSTSYTECQVGGRGC